MYFSLFSSDFFLSRDLLISYSLSFPFVTVFDFRGVNWGSSFFFFFSLILSLSVVGSSNSLSVYDGSQKSGPGGACKSWHCYQVGWWNKSM